MLRPGSSTYFAPVCVRRYTCPSRAGTSRSSVWWRTRVGTRIVGRTARTSSSATRGITRASGPLGSPPGVPIVPTLPGSPPSTACPDLATCCISPAAPHARQRGLGLHLIEPSVRSAWHPRNRRARPARLCETDVSPRTVPLSRTRRPVATRTASRLPRSSSTAVMLSAHCSKVGIAPGGRDPTLPCPAGQRRSADQGSSSPRPTLEGTVAPEQTSQHVNQSRRPRCREHLRVTRDTRRANPRSARTASPRTPQKSKPRSGSSGAHRQRLCCSQAFP